MRATAGVRLAASLLSATVLHGVAFGVAAVVLSGEPATTAAAPVPLDVEVLEVTPPRPDPIADAAPRPALVPAKLPSAAPARHRARELPPARAAAVASTPAPVDPTAAADAPGPSVPAPPAAPIGPAITSPRQVVAARLTGGAAPAQPRYRSNPKPEYPLVSRRRHEEGVVLLKVHVRPDGLPDTISLQRSSGYTALDRAAQEQVRRSWTFEPARTADGVAVGDTVVVNIRFSLSDQP